LDRTRRDPLCHLAAHHIGGGSFRYAAHFRFDHVDRLSAFISGLSPHGFTKFDLVA
jgi:hypothetical protein